MKNKKQIETLLLNPDDSQTQINPDEISNLANELHNLGELAADFAPKPLKKLEINSRNSTFSTWVKPAMAMGFAVMLLLFVAPDFFNSKGPDDSNIDSIYQDIENDTVFMAEVDNLVDSAAYIDFYEDSDYIESTYDFSDEFIEVVVPI